MNHGEFDQENMVDRYVVGHLTAEEAARFEDHFMNCDACLEMLEEAEGLRQGLKTFILEQQTAKTTVPRRTVPRIAVAAGILLPLLLSASLWLRLQQATAPQVAVPSLQLVSTRGIVTANHSFDADSPWLELRITVDRKNTHPMKARLSKSGHPIWEGPVEVRNHQVLMRLHRATLKPGYYSLMLWDNGAAEGQLYGSYDFEIHPDP